MGRVRQVGRVGRPGSNVVPSFPAAPAALLAALVIVAFANSFGAGLVLDNRAVILDDARVHAVTIENLRLILGKTYWWPLIPTALYRPLTTLSYLFNYAVLGNGIDPAGYHAVNLLLHLTNALLVFSIGRRLTRMWLAWAVAALWAVHPVLTEAVTNVVGRADLLAATGILGALWCHIRAGDTSDRRRRRWWRIGVGTVAAIGVFSKESGVAVAAVIPLWDLLVAHPKQPPHGLWRGWMPLVPPLLLFLAARTFVLSGQPAGVYPFVDNPIVGATWWRARLTAVAVIANYLKLVVWPFTLSCDYSFPQITATTGAPSDWLRLLLVAATAVGLLAISRVSPPLAFVSAAAAAAFLPASNLLFTTGTIMAERLLYLAAIAPLAVLVAGAVWIVRRIALRPAAGGVALGLLLTLLGTETVLRNRVWRDEVTLWSAAVDAAPRSFKTHGALAEALYQSDESRANLPLVIAHKERSLALLEELPDPLLVTDVYGQAATYYLERGDWLQQHEAANARDARSAYTAAAKWAQRFVDAIDAGRPEAQRPSPKQRAEAQLLLSTATLKADDTTGAIAAARRGRDTDPFSAATYQAEAAALVSARRESDAAVTLLTGFIVTGDTGLRTAVIAMYEAGLDPAGCAVAQGRNGPVLNQQCEVVQRHLCAASSEAASVFAKAGRLPLAEQARNAALQQYGCTQ
jgi:hypothetical protein